MPSPPYSMRNRFPPWVARSRRWCVGFVIVCVVEPPNTSDQRLVRCIAWFCERIERIGKPTKSDGLRI
jgi:hypothetical protein